MIKVKYSEWESVCAECDTPAEAYELSLAMRTERLVIKRAAEIVATRSTQAAEDLLIAFGYERNANEGAD